MHMKACTTLSVEAVTRAVQIGATFINTGDESGPRRVPVNTVKYRLEQLDDSEAGMNQHVCVAEMLCVRLRCVLLAAPEYGTRGMYPLPRAIIR